MSSPSIKFEYDPQKLIAKYGSRAKTAQIMLDNEIMKDTDKYVRFQTGILARSVQTATKAGTGRVIYDTPYAHKMYYDDDSHVTKDTHPSATPQWFEASKKVNINKWKALVEKVLKGES